MTREDTLKEKNSGASCDKVRTITKNCKDKVEKDGGRLEGYVHVHIWCWIYYSTHSSRLIIEGFHAFLCRRN